MFDRRQFLTGVGAAGVVAASGWPGLTRALDEASAGAVTRLGKSLDGELLLPSAADFDAARRPFSFNPRTDRRPALIVRAASDGDVARALEFGRENELPITVRAGGHDVLGLSTGQDGLMIDLRRLQRLELDAGDHVEVGAGVLAGSANATLSKNGVALALGCNDLPSVGGLALGGGLGWFVATQGATCDALVGARVVTADGRIINASRDENPELLWALRGGGGNFGVVTAFEFETFPLTDVTGGALVFDGSGDGSRLADFLRHFRDFMNSRPDELVVELIVRGIERRYIVATFCFRGSEAEARKALGPLRGFAEPLAEAYEERPYPRAMDPTPAINAVFRTDAPRPAQASDGPGIHWLGGLIPELTDAAIEVIVRQLGEADFDWAFNLGHHFHGAVGRSGADESALLRPVGAYTFHFDSWWSAADRAAPQMAWVDRSLASMQPHMGPDYVNYMSTTEAGAVRRAYGDRYERLLGIKRRLDPDNVFRANRNIT